MSGSSPVGATALGSMQDLVRRHHVRLSVYREYGPDEQWQQQAVGFDVELRAIVVAEHPLQDVEAQREAYDALFQIASSAFRVLDDKPGIAYELDAFDGHVVVEGGGGPVEVELAGHIFRGDCLQRELCDKERRALDEVRQRLRSFGLRD